MASMYLRQLDLFEALSLHHEAERERDGQKKMRAHEIWSQGRNAELGFCAHEDCGGRRLTRPFRGYRFCWRHWRQRRSVARRLISIREREQRLERDARRGK